MGRRPGSRQAKIWVRRYSRGEQRRSNAFFPTAIVVVLLLSLTSIATAATLGKGSNSRDDRAEAAQAIPFDRLTPEARQKIAAVVENPSLFRRMPTSVIDCDPQMHRFLVRYPEVVVNIWQLMGITRVTADRVSEYTLNAKDGVGTTSKIELVYGDQDEHLMYCEGHYEGPLFRRPLTGRCVLLLRSAYAKTDENRWNVTNQMDVFLQIDNVAIDVVTRTLHPLLGKSAELNFVQSTQFLERISRTAEENGSGMSRLAQRLDNVQPEVRDEFEKLTQAVFLTAQSEARETVASNELAPASQTK